ncbi:MAG TPA: hypothetical protein VKX16_04815 [Chloroflexota bacterium]|nr:hypothetical protein [Chloroflexota bacterium]
MSALLWIVIFGLLLVNFVQELPHVRHHEHLSTALFGLDLVVLVVAVGLLVHDYWRGAD